MRKSLFVLYFLLTYISIENTFAQIDTMSLTNEEVKEVIVEIDSLSRPGNYHIMLRPIAQDTFHINVWKNDRLGSAVYGRYGINICRFFKLNHGLVFIYEIKKCNFEVPSEYITNLDIPSNESLFYEGEFSIEILVIRKESELEISNLEPIKDFEIEDIEL